MPKLRVTDPKGLRYRTRMLAAGTIFEPQSRIYSRLLIRRGQAEPADRRPAAVKAAAPAEAARPADETVAAARPAPAPQPSPPQPPPPRPEPPRPPEPRPLAAADDGDVDHEALTRDELLGLAQRRGIALPPGYVSKGRLVGLLRGRPRG